MSHEQACIDCHTRRRPSYLARSMTLDPATTTGSVERPSDTPPHPPSRTELVSGNLSRRSTPRLLPLSSKSLALMSRVSRNDGSGLGIFSNFNLKAQSHLVSDNFGFCPGSCLDKPQTITLLSQRLLHFTKTSNRINRFQHQKLVCHFPTFQSKLIYY